MKAHTTDFKNTIKQFGRELDSKITFTIDEEEIVLGKEVINSVTPHYESSLLKSVMKQLDIDSNVEIPIGTIINYQFGVKVGSSFEYLDFGNYVVYKVEKQEDTRSWKITCYDKMLYAMKNYEQLVSKNLFDYTKNILYSANIDYNPNSMKIYTDNSCNLSYIECEPNTTYTISRRSPTAIRFVIATTEVEPTINVSILSANAILNDTQMSVTITTPSNAHYIVVRFIYNQVSEYETYARTIQIEKGSQATAYIPFFQYPITIKNYLKTLCYNIGLELKDTYFVNYNKEITGELYLDGDGNSLDYTYRDVLDEIAQATASVICINEDDELEVRYPQNVGEYETQEGTSFTIENVDDSSDLAFDLNGNTSQNGTPTPSSPIEVETVTGGQDIEVCGKNLFDKDDNSRILNAFINGNNKTITELNDAKTLYIPCNPNTQYTVSKVLSKRFVVISSTNYEIGSIGTNQILNHNATEITITTGNEDKYLCVFYYLSSADTLSEEEIRNSIQIEKGNQATTYEEYIGNTYEINLGTTELCKIGDYKDKIYKDNGKWYLYKAINKVVFDGSSDESWRKTTDTSASVFVTNVLGRNPSLSSSSISNYFKYQFANIEGKFYFSSNASNGCAFCMATTYDLDSFKTWLGTHNTEVYYVLAIPITTEITDTELINQLESVRLLQGLNNVAITSDNLSTPIKMTYLKYFDTIDEEYLKDVNVNFGEKYGPVNSVVLSRSAESDNIYQNDETSIEENGLTEIKIKDNQILNGNNRDEFLQGIFNQLNGLEYYVNDYTSTGIAYYDLADMYGVKVEDNLYKCLMLNDELDVTQGLQETIHAEKMEDSETDYTKADKTDRKINQAYIIVDKQNQQINSVVQTINTMQNTINNQGEQIDALGTRITQTVDNITASVTSIQEELDNGVNLVKTTSVIVDDNGLTVATDTSKTTTTMTSEKFTINSGGKELAFFGYDDTIGSTKAQMDNLTVTNYFVSGYHRTEKYDINFEHRTGVFYIGE